MNDAPELYAIVKEWEKELAKLTGNNVSVKRSKETGRVKKHLTEAK